ncbi:MAG: hypothetical protein JW714_03730 [Candidatus Omnitrophica bacterium]|nr:hypothetical protein [Candidatus Omnitrophota bacterium]
MKPIRVFLSVAVVVTIALTVLLLRQDYLKERSEKYGSFNHISVEEFVRVNNELDQSLARIEELNAAISTLKNENSDYQDKLAGLKQEKDQLQAKMASLIEEKTILEKQVILLVERFHSVKELSKAIKIAKLEQRQQAKIERLKKRIAKMELLQAMDRAALKQGNQGYLVKNFQSTLRPTRIRVELEPANRFSYREIDKE